MPARDGHVLGWVGSVVMPEVPQKTLEIGDWGRVIMTPPGPSGEPGDIRIEFEDTLEARRKALEFAKELHGELLARMHGLSVEFVPASDHYHLLIGDYPMSQARTAARLAGSIYTGALSGRGGSVGSVKASTNHIKHRSAED
jgi:hypothetical protein